MIDQLVKKMRVITAEEIALKALGVPGTASELTMENDPVFFCNVITHLFPNMRDGACRQARRWVMDHHLGQSLTISLT